MKFSPAISNSFREALTYENRTLKRALTDPRILSGIGNAYSDEILHAAQAFADRPHAQIAIRKNGNASTPQRAPLCKPGSRACDKKRKADFPEKVTAFREDMAVHGRYGQPCPRLRRKNSANSLRRQRNELLRPSARPEEKFSPTAACRACSASDWPRTLDELEALKRR